MGGTVWERGGSRGETRLENYSGAGENFQNQKIPPRAVTPEHVKQSPNPPTNPSCCRSCGGMRAWPVHRPTHAPATSPQNKRQQRPPQNQKAHSVSFPSSRGQHTPRHQSNLQRKKTVVIPEFSFRDSGMKISGISAARRRIPPELRLRCREATAREGRRWRSSRGILSHPLRRPALAYATALRTNGNNGLKPSSVRHFPARRHPQRKHSPDSPAPVVRNSIEKRTPPGIQFPAAASSPFFFLGGSGPLPTTAIIRFRNSSRNLPSSPSPFSSQSRCKKCEVSKCKALGVSI